jgi:hypothetical protein
VQGLLIHFDELHAKRVEDAGQRFLRFGKITGGQEKLGPSSSEGANCFDSNARRGASDDNDLVA